MKIKKFIQYIKEDLEQEDLEQDFIFLHDLDLEYSIDVHWMPTFKEYSNGDYFDASEAKFPGDDKLFIFDHEYVNGFSIYIAGNLPENDWKDFYISFGSTINWLKLDGYNYNWLSNVNPDDVIDFMSGLQDPENLSNLSAYSDKYKKLWNKIHIYPKLPNVESSHKIILDLDLFFAGPEKKKLTAKEMAELYEWSYQKSDGKNIWIKYNNIDLLDRILGSKNQWYESLNSDDIDWTNYYYYTPDFDMMGSYTSKNIKDRLKSILKSEERFDSKLWQEFKELYTEEYEELSQILGDMYEQETAFQQKKDIEKSWEKYLNDLFIDIQPIEDENNQWMIKVESKWFIYDGVGDYTGFVDVLDNYLNNDSFNTFNPTYRDYPDISNKMVEDEWLPILNKIEARN